MSDSIWTYFTKEKDNEKAKCLKCANKYLSCKGSSTSGLIRHLQHVHKINILKRNANDDQGAGPSNAGKFPTKSTNQPLISRSTFIKRQSMSEIVARLAAVDGFSIHGICKSEFIRQALSDRQYNLPKNKSNVMKLIHEYYKFAKCEVMSRIKSHQDSCGKFSLTLDEWTSLRNRRYLNINIHFNKKYINLGLVKIDGSCTADKIINLVNSKLSDFNISSSDVVASTTDAAAVMLKFGRLCEFIHQLCYNHGIHLAVVDVIYNKNNTENDTSDNVSSSSSSYNDDFSVSDNDDEDGHNDDVIYLCEVDNIKPALQMVRKIVKFFKISPKRNSILQEYVKEKHGVELSLLLDCKTRWNSIVTMVERFLKLFDSVSLALNDLGSVTLLNDDNIQILRNICNALKPVKLAVEALSSRDVNLVTADAILKFLFDTLRENTDNISRELLTGLSIRIKERRNQDLVSLVKFMQTLDLQSTATKDLPSSSKTAIIRFANEIFTRLSLDKSDEDKITIQSEDSSEEDNPQILDIKDKLAGAISAALKKKVKKIETKTNLQKEFTIYETTGNISKNLQNLLDALISIQPTSIESERVFSVSSNFCSKRRSSLSDFSLDCLSFLKCYFLNK